MNRIKSSLLAAFACLILSAMTMPNLATIEENDNPSCIAQVDLLSFKVKVENEHSMISWISISEENVQKYILERSIDNNDFAVIANVNAAVNSKQIIRYRVNDKPIAKQSVIYRLKVRDGKGGEKSINAVQLVEAQIIGLASK